MLKGRKKKVKKLDRVEFNFSHRKSRGIYDLAFFNNMRKNLEEVP